MRSSPALFLALIGCGGVPLGATEEPPSSDPLACVEPVGVFAVATAVVSGDCPGGGGRLERVPFEASASGGPCGGPVRAFDAGSCSTPMDSTCEWPNGDYLRARGAIRWNHGGADGVAVMNIERRVAGERACSGTYVDKYRLDH